MWPGVGPGRLLRHEGIVPKGTNQTAASCPSLDYPRGYKSWRPIEVVARPVVSPRRPRVRVPSRVLHVAQVRASIQAEGHESCQPFPPLTPTPPAAAPPAK